MTDQELKKDRYKVIGTYPRSEFKIDDIIEREGDSVYFNNGKGNIVVFPNEFPLIFQKIELKNT